MNPKSPLWLVGAVKVLEGVVVAMPVDAVDDVIPTLESVDAVPPKTLYVEYE